MKEINLKKYPLCEKYRASCFADVKGQDLAIEKLKSFFKEFPRRKAVTIYGPTGTGKTSLAYAIASELDYEIIELNASDLRNQEQIEKIIRPASKQMSLFKRGKIILIDEVDGITTKDRGGLQELLEIINQTAFPIVITANDIWQQKFSQLRQISDLIPLKEVDYRTIFVILNSICEKEKIQVNRDVLTSIAIKARGDIRAAINDIESMSSEPILVKEVFERNKEESIFTALQYIFKNVKLDTKMIDVLEEVNMPIDELFLWIEENIPMEYKGIELYNAFEALSRADIFKGRIYRQQHWRFLVYEYFFLGPGVASSKKYNKMGWTSYKKPSRILKIWLQNQRNAKKKTICQKYARKTHLSTRETMKNFMLIKIILKNPNIRNELDLSSEEIEYLDKPIS